MAKRIVVLDDEQTVVRFFASALSRRGYAVIVAESAEGAIRTCSDPAQGIDALVTDVFMPDSPGAALAMKIIRSRPDIAILFVSGTPISDWNAADKTRFDSLRGAAIDFQQKPFLPDVLVEKLRKLLNRREFLD